MVIPLKVQEIVAEAVEEHNADVRFTATEDGYAFLILYTGSYKGLTILSFLPDTSEYNISYLSGKALDALKSLL
jgi:hypothetical protein